MLFGSGLVRLCSPVRREEFPKVVDAERIVAEPQRNILPGNTSLEELERGETHLGRATDLLPRTAFLEVLNVPKREEANAAVPYPRSQDAAGFEPPDSRHMTA